MMYLSRLRLCARAHHSEAFWRLAGDPYRMHQETWRLFGAGPDAARNFLYRFEESPRGPLLYGLSAQPVRDPEGVWQAQSKPFEPVLRVGDQLGFSVRVNPTRQRDGKRHDVVMDAKFRARHGDSNETKSTATLVQVEVEKWFESRSVSRGFRPLGLRADGYRVQEFHKRGGRPIRITTCDLAGLLEVTDPDAFVAAVLRGLGPAKAFGCGLLLLRRV